MVDITGARLGLRELRPDDVDAVYAIYGDEEATRHLSFEPRSREQVEAIVERSIASAGVDPRTEFATAVIRVDEVIGFARLALDPHSPRGATIGFALRPNVWGGGYGVETVHLLAALAFRTLDLHRIWGARAPLNEVSGRTMERAGFIREGTIREHVHVRGAWRDSVVYALLDHEWKTPAGFGG
ncbi:GNAT family protein [Streptomyces sp. SID3343]|uniref:GNAT family N-acetyltransferase n=1 Tax=Streptomyces sp. SID3343 TaxID=2690260 RepID=UPI00136C50FE|nr:GNAT family protein [Streptomyces sp. SID3343]MYW02520.1 GNAT family N-acetyltransferase [Streptomyces sp. SID3343]